MKNTIISNQIIKSILLDNIINQNHYLINVCKNKSKILGRV